MAKHIRALGLPDPGAYLRWCEQMGVHATMEKSPAERDSELELLESRATAAKKRARVHHNPRKFLQQVCCNEIAAEDVSRPGWSEIAATIAKTKDDADHRRSLLEFLLQVDDVSDLVFATTSLNRQTVLYVDALIRLHERRRQWIREPEEWRPTSHNLGRQFSSLLRHLLTRYDVPKFIDSAWLRSGQGAYRFRGWFIHIGAGKNIRSAKTLYPMTRMMAHNFIGAPDKYSIEGALMLADIVSLGGGRRLTETLMATRLGGRVERDTDKRAFWLSVYRFFIDNPMLDLRHAGPIVDFLSFQKFETREVMVGPGQVERRPPPQPNLSMARRTPYTLLRQVEAWHGELRTDRANDKRFWKSSGFAGAEMETGPRERPEQRVHWRVRELLSGQELVEEGRELRHCVASYADSCIRGVFSIWSLERREFDGRPSKELTIAVDGRGMVVEARGFSNRFPTEQEKPLLEFWMKKAGLRPGPYLYGW